jgi:hypothetical protein
LHNSNPLMEHELNSNIIDIFSYIRIEGFERGILYKKYHASRPEHIWAFEIPSHIYFT